MIPRDIQPLLNEIELLSSLTPDTQAAIASVGSIKEYPPNTEIIAQGEACKGVFFIIDGQVKVYRMAVDGREQVVNRVDQGKAFNTVPPLQEACVNHSFARSLTDVTLLMLRTEDFLRLLQTRPDFSYAILCDHARRLLHLTNLVEDLSLHTVRGRLAGFLLTEAKNDELPAYWTQEEIAYQLGTVRDIVGRVLRSFEEAGWIQKTGRRIALANRTALEEESKF